MQVLFSIAKPKAVTNRDYTIHSFLSKYISMKLKKIEIIVLTVQSSKKTKALKLQNSCNNISDKIWEEHDLPYGPTSNG